MITILFSYFWIILIIVTVINASIFRYQSRKYIAKAPELKLGYDQLFKGMIFYGNIPWIIMGIGVLFGLTNGIFDYFRPRSLNAIVLIFHFSIVFIWILAIRWIYFKNGAEFIEQHQGFFQSYGFGQSKHLTAKQIKLFFPIMLAGGVAGMIIMWCMDIPDTPTWMSNELSGMLALF